MFCCVDRAANESDTNAGFSSAALTVPSASTSSNSSPMQVAWGNSQLQDTQQRRAAVVGDEDHSSRVEPGDRHDTHQCRAAAVGDKNHSSRVEPGDRHDTHQRRAGAIGDEEHSSRVEPGNRPEDIGGLCFRSKGKDVQAVKGMIERLEWTVSRGTKVQVLVLAGCYFRRDVGMHGNVKKAIDSNERTDHGAIAKLFAVCKLSFNVQTYLIGSMDEEGHKDHSWWCEDLRAGTTALVDAVAPASSTLVDFELKRKRKRNIKIK
ncbi:hypothetical protein EJ07DRAFT_150421 [Lizonia empirigonia]|nr:hypothetical protein EJ07DRAFT_150421 [Lizonia empirigonia]